jgi:hypothetical protein
VWIVGTPDEVAREIEFFREQLSLRHLTIVPMFPGA